MHDFLRDTEFSVSTELQNHVSYVCSNFYVTFTYVYADTTFSN